MLSSNLFFSPPQLVSNVMPKSRKSSSRGSGRGRAPKRYKYSRVAPLSRATRPRVPKRSAPKRGLNAGEQIGQAVGRVVGNLGQKAFGALKRYVGLGDYHVRRNVIMYPSQSVMSNPATHGGVRIRRREFIGDIVSSGTAGAFKIQTFDLNPGVEETHPFLGQIAPNYQEYAYEGIVFEYVPTSGNAITGANTALGQVILACNYNAANPPFASAPEMQNSEGCVSGVPSMPLVMGVECDPRQTAVGSVLYVRPGDVPAGQDQRLYDLGKFQIATSGCQGTNVVLGQLWVTYQVELLKPVLSETLGNTSCYFHWRNFTGVASGTPLGTGSGTEVKDTFGCVVDTATRTVTITPCPATQNFMIEIAWLGGAAAAIVYPLLTFTNMTSFPGLLSPTLNQVPLNGVSTVCLRYCQAVQLPANGLPHSFTVGSAGTIPGGGTPVCEIIITQIPQGTPGTDV